MFPVKKDIKIYQGEDFMLALAITGDEVSSEDIEIKSCVKRNRHDRNILFEFDIERREDMFLLQLDPEVTMKLDMQKDIETYVYDIKIMYQGVCGYLQHGYIKLHKSVTE